jgi:hypothetical protein
VDLKADIQRRVKSCVGGSKTCKTKVKVNPMKVIEELEI